MNKCKEFAEHFSEFIDSELSDDIKKNTEEHLKECHPCDTIAKDVRSIVDSLKKCREIKVSDQFEDSLRKQLGHEMCYLRKKKKIQWFFNVAATFTLVFSFSWLYFNSSSNDEGRQLAELENSHVGVVKGSNNSKLVNYSSGSNISGGYLKEVNWLGMRLEQLNEKEVVVDYVFPDNPAHRSGLKEGDVLLTCNGTKVSSLSDVESSLKDLNRNSIVKLDVKRKDQIVQIDIPIETRLLSN